MKTTPINIKKLKVNTILYVETEDYVYKITIMDSNGICSVCGGAIFPDITESRLMGVVEVADQSQVKYPSQIYKDMCLEFKLSDNNHTFITTQVKGVSIERNSWRYDVWGD